MRISELAFSHPSRSLCGGQEGSLLIALESCRSSLLVENFVSAACCSFMAPRKDGSYRFSLEPYGQVCRTFPTSGITHPGALKPHRLGFEGSRIHPGLWASS